MKTGFQIFLLSILVDILLGNSYGVGKRCSGAPRRTITVNLTEKLVVKCNTTGNLTIRWYADKGGNNETLSNSSLLIMDTVREEHRGQYCCVATKDGHESPVPVELVIISVQYAPALHSSVPTTQLVEFGSTTLLYCLARGNPPPRYTWTKNGEKLAGENVDHIADNLILLKVRDSSALGDYECSAKNILGVMVHRVHVSSCHARTASNSLNDSSLLANDKQKDQGIVPLIIISSLSAVAFFMMIALITVCVTNVKLKRVLVSRKQRNVNRKSDSDLLDIEETQSDVVKTPTIRHHPSPISNLWGTNGGPGTIAQEIQAITEADYASPLDRDSACYMNADVAVSRGRDTHVQTQMKQWLSKNGQAREDRHELQADGNTTSAYTDLFKIKLKESGRQDYANMPREETDYYMPLGPEMSKCEKETRAV